MNGQKSLPRVLNIVLGAIMGDAQALSGVEEKIEESKHNVGSGKRHCSTQHPTLQALGGWLL